jgi:hypothetical protein
VDIYKLSQVNAEEYIRIKDLKGQLQSLYEYVQNDELQHLNKNPVQVETGGGGIELPDYLVYEGLSLFSDRLKRLLEKENIYYIFFKKVQVVVLENKPEAVYWLAVVPQIDCLDLEASNPKNTIWDCFNGFHPQVEVERIVINEKCLGHYTIFRIAGIGFESIFVTSSLYALLLQYDLIGIEYIPLK